MVEMRIGMNDSFAKFVGKAAGRDSQGDTMLLALLDANVPARLDALVKQGRITPAMRDRFNELMHAQDPEDALAELVEGVTGQRPSTLSRLLYEKQRKMLKHGYVL